MGKYFGTDGFRGEANKELTAAKAFKVGRYIGWYYGQQHDDGRARIIIGKDTRRSSYTLEYALSAGITSSGSDAYLLHVTTTPSVSYCCRTDGFDCGIMISASHNPFYDNGIKIMRANGQKIEAEIEEKIEAYIDSDEDLPLAEREAMGNVVDYAAGRNRYIGYLMTVPTRAFNGYKVGLDCANGASWNIARAVYEALGAKVYVINNTPDGVNINQNCGSTHMEALQQYVVDNGLNVGFAYDGDADRCLAVDEKGRIVNGDQIMFMCGKYMQEEGLLDGNTIVTTIMSNMGLYKACDAIGIHTEKTAVGDKYVAENMMANGYVLGGEQSGHIIFGKYATTGDGILTSLMVMMTMLDKKMPLSMLADEMKMYPQCLKNVRVKSKPDAQNDPDVQAAVKAAADALGNSGRILVRESGTEPKIRVMVEAESDEICEKYVDSVIEVIKAFILGEEFLGGEAGAMVLGDNIFYGNGFRTLLKAAVKDAEENGRATVFGYYVPDPERFGVVEFDENGKALSIEEKPKEPKSNYAVTGLYFYPAGVSKRANMVQPSARGELEITTLNEMYLNDGLLDVQLLGRGFAWLDTGTMSSLLQAANFVEMIQSRQGITISAPEEIAYINGFIDKEKLMESAKAYGKSPYGEHLKAVAEGKVRY